MDNTLILEGYYKECLAQMQELNATAKARSVWRSLANDQVQLKKK